MKIPFCILLINQFPFRSISSIRDILGTFIKQIIISFGAMLIPICKVIFQISSYLNFVEKHIFPLQKNLLIMVFTFLGTEIYRIWICYIFLIIVSLSLAYHGFLACRFFLGHLNISKLVNSILFILFCTISHNLYHTKSIRNDEVTSGVYFT